MDVTLISSLPPHKGITPYTLQLIEALSSHPDITVDAIGFRSMYPRMMYPGGEPEHVDLAALDESPGRRVMSWWDPTSWVRAGMSAKGDIVHAQWWSWFLAPSYITALGAAKRRGQPIVMTVHNTQPHELSGWKQRLNTAVIQMADHLIVHTERNRDTLAEMGISRSKISVIPLGVQAEPIAGEDRATARRALGIDEDARMVFLPGNIRRYKGTRVLAEAIGMLRGDVPKLRAVIAGELWKGSADPTDEVKALGVADLFDIRLGYVPDTQFRQLFDAADVVVLPYTHFDAQSAAATHALTAERALVVSDVGGLPDLVRDARAVVRGGDPSALAASLGAVLLDADLRRKLEGDTATVREAMSWSGVVEQTLAVYRQLTDAQPRELTRAA
jgi:glycosyltransferase involved in cell wall biosynthesis